MSRLTGSQVKQIQEALLNAYPDRSALAMMLRLEMDLNLDAIVGGNNMTDVCFNLVSWAESRGLIDELVAAAKRSNPGNPALQALTGDAKPEPSAKPPASTPPATKSAAPVDDSDEDGYDVFISYSHKDGDWVRNVLLPNLEGAGLRVCIDYRDFELGLSALLNMEDAVEKSRHTLLVLTPNWIGGEWTAYEAILTQTADPIGLRRRTIPLLREPCALPSRIAMLTYADFTGPDDAQPWDRLLRSLRQG